MGNRVFIAGVGMIPFSKPSAARPYTTMGTDAIRLALHDTSIDYGDIQQVYVGYVYGDSTCGQRVAYEVGMTGIPVFNVNNNCATGSAAIYLARQAILGGISDCTLAVGFEQMPPGAISAMYSDRPSPTGKWRTQAERKRPRPPNTPPAAHLFGSAALEYQEIHGTKNEVFAMISAKARKHAAHNERAIFRDAITVEDVLNSAPVFGVLTRLQCCPPTCGAAAAVLVSEQFAKREGLNVDVEILSQAMVTDLPSTFGSGSAIKAVGYDMSEKAALAVYEAAGISPVDLDVCELHDCFTANELLSYEALHLVPPGGAERFIRNGANTYGGEIVVNPSGGLLSKGHPLGATGVAQCVELVDQIKGRCGARQVENVRLGLQHNIGIGGACVVTAYGRAKLR